LKVANFLIHTLIFLAAWLGLAVWGWGFAQALSTNVLMPWVLPIVSFSPPTVALAMAGAVAILGSFLAAMVSLVVLLALEAIGHFLHRQSKRLSAASPS
jgi:hypothetical protein